MPPVGAPALVALTMLTLLAGCGGSEEAPAPEIRPVRVVTIEERPGGETVALTGTVQAEATVDLAFRINGRMTDRPVKVGDTVAPGLIVARLDPENEENALRAARRRGRGDGPADRGQEQLSAPEHAASRRLDHAGPL
jgi:membrane fusion protein, multidrug efflux system